ncbi:hypothetical protein K440DRAFT_669707 [Wilcoxina mikolae CBS 423.85]|nr:hypothetical protein K440DRAFT_669707 [Wilcoxina mikolae CBS 423.85]
MIIDGVKMACEACIRGHRVSGCNHHDRKLLPIAKKGRPVSQCNHCRSMRKSRAAHVKCDCGERIALMKEQAKNGIKPAPLNLGEAKSVGGAIGVTGGSGGCVPNTCPCCHGGHCTCALKKEPQHLDAVPEFSEPPSARAVPALEVRTKPRLQMTHSESSLTTFANGHHKPTHKHHSSIHGTCPYSIPTVGHTGHTFGEHNGCTKAQSVSPSGKSRRIKSEQSSPDLRTYPALQLTNTGITPLELTPRLPHSKPAVNRTPGSRGLSLNTNHQSFTTMHDFSSQDLLPSADSENGYHYSAGLLPQSAGWPPSFPPYDNSQSYDEAQQPPPQMDLETFLSLHTAPALTNSTSGDERDDLGTYGGPSPPPYGYGNGAMSSSSSDHADSENYHLSATSSYVGLPQVAEDMPQLSNGGFDANEFDGILVSAGGAMPPSSGIDSFEAGLVAGADGLFDSGDLGLGTYGNPGNYSPHNMSPHHQVMVTKGMDSVPLVMSPPATIPPPEDGDYLWMAPWSNAQ